MTQKLRNTWTDEQCAILMDRRAYNVDWSDIAEALGHSSKSCQHKHSRILQARRDAKLGIGQRRAKSNRRPWGSDDIARLIEMREVQRMQYGDIDVALGRALGTSCSKYLALRRGLEAASNWNGRIEITAAERERDARRHLTHSTLTGWVFGDPLPGRSALDRRGAQQ